MCKTPADLDREIEFPLRRFWAKHGSTFDTAMGVLVFSFMASGAWFLFGYRAVEFCVAVSFLVVCARSWATRNR